MKNHNTASKRSTELTSTKAERSEKKPDQQLDRIGEVIYLKDRLSFIGDRIETDTKDLQAAAEEVLGTQDELSPTEQKLTEEVRQAAIEVNLSLKDLDASLDGVMKKLAKKFPKISAAILGLSFAQMGAGGTAGLYMHGADHPDTLSEKFHNQVNKVADDIDKDRMDRAVKEDTGVQQAIAEYEALKKKTAKMQAQAQMIQAKTK